MFTVAAALQCDAGQKKRLEDLVRAGKTPQKIVQRAQIILLAARGMSNNRIAKAVKTTRPTVLLWRERFERLGCPGLLKDWPRPGRKPKISDEKVQEVIELTLHSQPEGATHWSTRTLAKKTRLSHVAIQRIWKQYGLQPHRVETFKISTDTRFVEKLRDIVGLYLNPPERALVLSVDEKSQIQALDRTQPGLPLKRGRCGTMTHDYKRHGTTTLFAALNILDGTVIGECLPRHRSREFIRFLNTIDHSTPAELDLHLIVDNYSTHKSPSVQRWLKRHPRVHFHFTPTSASWLNMVERWFRELTQRRIRRGVFKSVQDLIAAIQEFLKHHHDQPKIFTWHKDAETILAKIEHCKEALVTQH
jgi:transposase